MQFCFHQEFRSDFAVYLILFARIRWRALAVNMRHITAPGALKKKLKSCGVSIIKYQQGPAAFLFRPKAKSIKARSVALTLALTGPSSSQDAVARTPDPDAQNPPRTPIFSKLFTATPYATEDESTAQIISHKS